MPSVKKKTVEGRFWPKVKFSDGCWEWMGHKNRLGYGRFNYGRVRNDVQLAHRVSLWLFGIETPEGMHTDHLCRNPSCVRPDHLEVVTPKENSKRGLAGKYRKALYENPNCPKCSKPYIWVKTDRSNRRMCQNCNKTRYLNRRVLKRKIYQTCQMCRSSEPSKKFAIYCKPCRLKRKGLSQKIKRDYMRAKSSSTP